MNNPYEAFSHGLIVSKLWLCEELEHVINNLNISQSKVHILGGWHNVLSFMMIVRQPNYYEQIDSYDIDLEATIVANKICDTWKFETPRVTNHTIDINQLRFDNSKNLIFINCSVDQVEGVNWYDIIPKNNIVVLQTTDIMTDPPPWTIVQRTPNIESLLEKYPVQTLLYKGIKNIDYGHLSYNRLMTIGIK